MGRGIVVSVLLLSGAALHAAPDSAGYPSKAEFARGVQQALLRDPEVHDGFTWLEHRRDVKISRLGKVSVGPRRTFEVHPSEGPGGPYKRLIAIEGKPLPAEELAERDAKHARDLAEAAARRRAESPEQRARREQEAREEADHYRAMVADAVAVYDAAVVGRERVDGVSVLVADLTPRPDAPVATREGRWMKRFAGRLWVAEEDYEIVRFEMRAIEDVSIGWGVIGRVHKGSSVRFARQLFEGVWLPAELSYEASGRTLLFRSFDIAAKTTYSSYQRRSDN